MEPTAPEFNTGWDKGLAELNARSQRIQAAQEKVIAAAELMESEPHGYYSEPPMRAVTGYVVKCSTFTELCKAVRELKAARGE